MQMDNKSKGVPVDKGQLGKTPRRLSKVEPKKDIYKHLFDATILLKELDSNSYTLTQYFAMYMSTSDQLDGIRKTLLESLKKYPLIQIYKLLYAGYKTLPKVYLMSILGSLIVLDNTKVSIDDNNDSNGNGEDHIIIEEDPNIKLFKRILQDIINLMKLIPYPSNSFCARYFVLTSFKQQLNLIDTTSAAEFLLENLKGMNSDINQSIKDKPEQIEEDKTLTIFINDNINSLLSLPGMNKIVFKDKVLSEILPLIYIQSEGIYNEFIIEWIISGLSEELAVVGLEAILAIMLPLYSSVDNNIPKKLKHIIDRLLNFLKENSLSKNELAELNNHFDQLFMYLNNITEMAKDKCMDIKQFLDFLDTLLTFVLCCANDKQKAANASSLLSVLNSYLEDYSKQGKCLNQEQITVYDKYCKDLMKNSISFFDIPILFSIAKKFKDEDTKTACYNLLLLIISFANKIDSSDKVSIVLEMITTILKTTVSNDNNNNNNYNSKLETINVIIQMIYTSDPGKMFEWYSMMKNIYLIMDPKYLQDSLLKFFLCYNELIKNCEYTYLVQHGMIEDNNSARHIMDLSNYTSEEDLAYFFGILYNITREEMKNTFSSFPDVNLKYLILTLNQINQHRIVKDKMAEQFLDSFNTFIKILLGETLQNSSKTDLTNQLIKIVSETSILTKEKYYMVGQAIGKIAKCFQKRTDTTKILLYSCELYNNNNIRDMNKIKELLITAFNEAEYVLVKIENLIIFPMILSKILYYVDIFNANGTNFVPLQIVDKIIQAIVDNLPTSKEDNAKLGGEVELQFNECKAHIKEMKEKGVEYYQEINIDK